MRNALDTMLQKYDCVSLVDYTNASKEIIQEIALLGLWRAKFFEHAAFYGGTALRILYGLNRFSEDLDFSLLGSNPDFNLTPYNNAIERELQGFGFITSVTTKIKTQPSNIKSAFIKANTVTQLINISAPNDITKFLPKNQKITIKIEVDIDPPQQFITEAKYLLQPIPFAIKTFSLPDLFAGKMHAILCRNWKTRVKGRDWFDLVWYISQNTPVNLQHLQARLQQSGHWAHDKQFDLQELHNALYKKIKALDIKQARQDVQSFLEDPDSIAIWSHEFFENLVPRIYSVGKTHAR